MESVIRHSDVVDLAACLSDAIGVRADVDPLRDNDISAEITVDRVAVSARTPQRHRVSSTRLGDRDALDGVASVLAEDYSDADDAVRSFVDHIKEYFACDLAYLTLNDIEAREAYVAYAVGDDLVPTRIPFGTGIAGRIASTARPFSTRDYLRDEHIVHVPSVDATIARTGQRAVMAAPMIHQGHVVGVLHASDKEPTAFSDDDVDVLAAFATIAAAASERARLSSELRSTNETLELETADVRRSISAHDRAMDQILQGGGVQEVVDTATEFLGGHLAVLDSHLEPLASSHGTTRETLDRMTRRWDGTVTDSVRRVALRAGSELLGHFAWSTPRTTTVEERDVRLFERTAVIASVVLLFRKHLTDAESEVRGELVTDLLRSNGTDLDAVRERARRVGFQVNDPQVVLTAAVAECDRRRLLTVLRDVAADAGGLSGTFDGTALVILPAVDAPRAAADLLEVLTAQIGSSVTVGASTVITEAGGLNRGFTDAAACLLALGGLGRSGQSASVAEMSHVGLMIGGGTSAKSFVQRTLGPVLSHDERRDSGLVKTLDEYFGCGQSLAHSAERLHVHANTVTQRLARCKGLLGVDFHDPDVVLEVQLALRLIRIGVLT